MVYHELWMHTPTILVAMISLRDLEHRKVRLFYGDALGHDTLGLPQWLLTNKAILEKGLKQLRDHMVVSWSHERTQDLKYDIANSWPLIDIFSATRFRIDISAISDNKQNVIRPNCIADAATKKLVARLNPNMKALDLRMEYITWHTAPSHGHGAWVVRLPSCDTNVFQHLETLVVRIDVASSFVNPKLYAACISAPLKEKVVELAGKSLGEKTRVVYRTEAVAYETEYEVVRKCGLEYRVERV
jgi:hypothetical protein